MIKKIIIVLLVIITTFGLTGCGMKYPELEKDAIGFQMSSYVDESNDDDGYLTFEYNGRTYMPYGIQKGLLKEKDLDKCIGYIIQDENSSTVLDLDNKDTRIYTLSDDKDNDFLMEYYIATNLMNDPIFYRAIDTKDKDIHIPSIIESLGYSYWE